MLRILKNKTLQNLVARTIFQLFTLGIISMALIGLERKLDTAMEDTAHYLTVTSDLFK